MGAESKEAPKPAPEPEPDAWIEKVVRVAGALGMNPVRVRWKLIRWQEDRRRAQRRREQWVTHVRYQHKTCPRCRAVQDRDEKACTACGAALSRRGVQVLQRIGLTAPELISMSTLLALAMLGVYLRVWIAAGGGLRSPEPYVLRAFGGHWLAGTAEQPWRLITAIFLHAGLWHLGFNLIAIASIGPRIEAVYGRLTMLMLFVVTGALGNLGSDLRGLTVVGIGASGGVMGLIGAAAGYGQRQGTAGGRALRNAMVQWSVYTFVFGFWIHADNWAHGFGLVTGAVFGYAVRPEAWSHPQLLLVRALGKLVGASGAIAALAIIFTRTPPPPPELRSHRAVAVEDGDDGDAGAGAGAAANLARMVEMCRAHADGDRAGRAGSGSGSRLDAATLERICEGLYDLRERCRGGPAGPAGANAPGENRRQHTQDSEQDTLRPFCDANAAALSSLPDRPARPPKPPGPEAAGH
jgi:membrane associated rhomboid family serine protease